MQERTSSVDSYALQRAPAETRRLQVQAQMLKPATQRLFEQAGIGPGMRVLELGSGAGDVALLLAERVGPQGEVFGVEIDADILETARKRVREAGFTNVSFVNADIADLPLEGAFDAIVGRLIFIHLPSPVSALHRLSMMVRPGGIVAFQEYDMAHFTTTAVHPPNTLAEQMFTWIGEAFRRVGLPLRMGLELYRAFLDAGLPAPQMLGEAMIITGTNQIGCRLGAETTRSLLPLILKFGLATAEEVGIDTLEERMIEEAVEQGLVMRGPDVISAWTRLPKE
jgi:ubiquinone/menaquinone biosynthesis C-methylase UbiE